MKRRKRTANQKMNGAASSVAASAFVGHLVEAPVRAGAAFADVLPGLVERFHEEVVELHVASAVEELAHEPGLRRRGRLGALEAVAAARPADFADDDLLGGIGLAQLLVAHQDVFDRVVDRHAFPEGQQVHGDEVDVLHQLRVLEPDVPGLGGGDRHLHRLPGVLEVADHLVDGEIAAQHRLVADHRLVDVAVLPHRLGERGELAQVVVLALVEPRARRDAQVVLARERRDGAVLDRRVRADPVGEARELGHVGRELFLRREHALGGILAGAEAAVGEAADLALPLGKLDRAMGPGPAEVVERRHEQCEREGCAGEPRGAGGPQEMQAGTGHERGSESVGGAGRRPVLKRSSPAGVDRPGP